MITATLPEIADHFTSATIGPRQVGGRYLSGYWRDEYVVTKIQGDWLTVVWSDGRQTVHCTPWDKYRDRVIAQPL